jgi:hypothetical protein
MTTDPRRPGGDIAGPGGPFDKDAVVLDPRNAVLLGSCEVCLVEQHNFQMGETKLGVAMVLTGRINKTTDTARILFLFDIDGAGDIIAQLFGLAERGGPEIANQLEAAFTKALNDQPRPDRSG